MRIPQVSFARPERNRRDWDPDHRCGAFAMAKSVATGFLLRLCLWIVACSCIAGTASSQPLIVALGDSNTAGWGVGQANAFPSQLNAMLARRGYDARIANAGVSGDTFGGMLSRLDRSVPAGTRLVIVQGGYNDLIRGTPRDVIVARMEGILAQLRARRIPAVLCGFFFPEWDAVGRRLAAQYGARFVPGSTCYSPRHTGPDRLHMSAEGHTVVAQRLMPVVASTLGAARRQPVKQVAAKTTARNPQAVTASPAR
jgi:acyl-CoA thioesterase-1